MRTVCPMCIYVCDPRPRGGPSSSFPDDDRRCVERTTCSSASARAGGMFDRRTVRDANANARVTGRRGGDDEDCDSSQRDRADDGWRRDARGDGDDG